MWLIAGERNGVWLNDVWYSSNGIDWNMATGNAAFSTRQAPGAYVYNNKMWIAGGYNGTDKNDVWWSTNGADWHLATSNAAWCPRSYPACAVYDNGTGPKMWLVGGGPGGTVTGYGDSWYSSDGANWTQAGNSFQTRFQARAEVFDNKLWIIGGINGVRLNDVWYTVNGKDFYQATGSAAFAPRSDGATFVYDSKMWYIAGIQTLGTQFNDVWYTCGNSLSTPVVTNPTYTPTPAYTPVPTGTVPPIVVSSPTPAEVPTVSKGDSTCYPTSAKDHLKIVCNAGKKCGVKIYVYDIAGKMKNTIECKSSEMNSDNTCKVDLDVRSYDPGVYYYTIQGKTDSGELINFKSNKFIVKEK